MPETLAAGAALLPVYASMPLRAVAGRGSWIIDDQGREWLDAYGGHAVASTGHCHPDVVRAISDQAAQLIFYSTAIPHHGREELADLIASLCPAPLGRLFFCNSGAEANENALGLARRHTGRSLIVSVAGGWHGRTAATQAVTDGARYEETARLAGLPVSRKVPFNDVAAMRAAVDQSVAAVIVEPVQGLTGARDCSVEFLRAAREACDAAGALLIFDEIQCGMGRTGTLWAFELTPVRPDVLTAAKALANGLPVGACIAGRRAADVLQPGDHGATFGGGPLVAAAALATLEILDDDALLSRVRVLGDRLRVGLEELRSAGRLSDVRGRGLMLGADVPAELEGGAAAVVARALEQGIVLNATGPLTLRFLPPLVITDRDVDQVLEYLRQAL
jgi:acetylornithine/succinyldiaminopimelate/putrescine aminotransferase